MRSEQVLVSKDKAHFNTIVVCQPKKQGKDILWRQAQGKRFPAAICLPNCCMTLPETQAKSQFLSPVSSCEHREMVPRSHSLPTGWARSWSAAFTLCGRKTRSPNHELLSVSVSSRAVSQFPSTAGAWGWGNQHSLVLVCVQNKLGVTPLEPAAAFQAGLGATFQLIPAPQAKVGADSLGWWGRVSCVCWVPAPGSGYARQEQQLCWLGKIQPEWNPLF